MKNPIVWVEIPVSDMGRAIEFYNKAFGWSLERFPMGPLTMAMFPAEVNNPGISGALVHHEEAYRVSPDDSGPLVYISTDKIDQQLTLIEKAGGKTLMPRKLISKDHGSMALFRDSERNRMALFSEEKE